MQPTQGDQVLHSVSDIVGLKLSLKVKIKCLGILYRRLESKIKEEMAAKEGEGHNIGRF